jgi:hypothetical protein
MSTRSSIAVEHANGTVSAIYCHFDGYLEGVGSNLVDAFNSQEMAETLVALGDLSSVGGDGPDAYSRDHGETFEDVKPRVYPDFATYAARVGKEIGDNGYRYIFRRAEGAWFVWNDSKPMKPVADALLAPQSEEGR